MLSDAGLPAVGGGFFYVLTATSAVGGEGTAGFETCAERGNPDPCP